MVTPSIMLSYYLKKSVLIQSYLGSGPCHKIHCPDTRTADCICKSPPYCIICILVSISCETQISIFFKSTFKRLFGKRLYSLGEAQRSGSRIRLKLWHRFLDIEI